MSGGGGGEGHKKEVGRWEGCCGHVVVDSASIVLLAHWMTGCSLVRSTVVQHSCMYCITSKHINKATRENQS